MRDTYSLTIVLVRPGASADLTAKANAKLNPNIGFTRYLYGDPLPTSAAHARLTSERRLPSVPLPAVAIRSGSTDRNPALLATYSNAPQQSLKMAA